MEGRVRYIGIAEKDPGAIRQAHAICPLSAVCIAMSPWNPPNGNPAVDVCRELGIRILATEVNARGLLSLDAGDVR